MNIELLKETLRRQCQVNHETVIAIRTLKRFNNNFSIISMMQEPHVKRKGKQK